MRASTYCSNGVSNPLRTTSVAWHRTERLPFAHAELIGRQEFVFRCCSDWGP